MREWNSKVFRKELPYFDSTGSLPFYRRKFNNLYQSELPPNRSLESLTGFYDLDSFKSNTSLDSRFNTNNNLFNHKIYGRFFSPHNFKNYSNSLTKKQLEPSSIFHNNILILNKNIEKLVKHYLENIDLHLDIIGITATKMTNTNQNFASKILCYAFEHVPTRLASRGVGLFIDGNLKYTVLEKESHGAFQASWIAISFNKQKNVICGSLDCSHNSPDCFSGYVSDTTQKVASTGKSIYLMSDFNVWLLKTEKFQYG